LWAFIAKNDKVSEELTLKYSHEAPCVGVSNIKLLPSEKGALQRLGDVEPLSQDQILVLTVSYVPNSLSQSQEQNLV
jgi:hypothetical protein